MIVMRQQEPVLSVSVLRALFNSILVYFVSDFLMIVHKRRQVQWKKKKIIHRQVQIGCRSRGIEGSEKLAEIAVKHDISSGTLSDGFSFSSTESRRHRLK